jgi:hypothetical protein
MATHHQAMKRVTMPLPLLSMSRSMTRYAFLCLAVYSCLGGLVACRQDAMPQASHIIGVWNSSRMNSRSVHLLANGEWEVRDAGSPKPLQFGLWRIEGRWLVWTYKRGALVILDKTQFESFEHRGFTLREQDGSLTRFTRVD